MRRDKRHASRVFNDRPADEMSSDWPVNSPSHSSRLDSAQFSGFTPQKRPRKFTISALGVPQISGKFTKITMKATSQAIRLNQEFPRCDPGLREDRFRYPAYSVSRKPRAPGAPAR